jgi:hypothetical protein
MAVSSRRAVVWAVARAFAWAVAEAIAGLFD